jgi:hypothetical protein
VEALLRRWWAIWWARAELQEGTLALERVEERGPGHPDVVGVTLPDRSLGLCDACNLAWGVELWLHPDQLLVTVLCRHHSTQQALALRERRWSRLVRPTNRAQAPPVYAAGSARA